MPEVVLVSVDGPVRSITLNRPEKRNALNGEMLDALHAAFSEPPGGEERLVVLRSNGPVFCAGLDLRERQADGTVGASSPIEKVLHAVEHHPLPVVAVVQGDAIAGGNELALHCDFVVASTDARFGMSLAQIGLAPTWFLAKKLLEVAGPVAAREILLLGDAVPAQQMRDYNIIARAVEPSALQEVAQAIIDRLAANAPLSLRAMKALLVREMQFRDGIAHEDVDALVAAARTSADAREGIAARLEKRAPRFTGQ
ncbi:MAG TPA: enoyl-CoA hydratase/isomerase family protein [Tepidiformaceae bacterium]|nr:enoyl-CoA hydratase/isomerase family protein [Tepidiformaceae bacterium]